jgi:FeS assembly SUF system protein
MTGNLKIMGLKDYFKKRAAEIAEENKERKMKIERDIIMALRQVYDPEIPVNVYDLGLIYEVRVDDEHDVYIQMTLTAPNCPMADYVVDQVKSAVEDVPGVVNVKIDLVWEPVWDKSRMSEEALVELGLDED